MNLITNAQVTNVQVTNAQVTDAQVRLTFVFGPQAPCCFCKLLCASLKFEQQLLAAHTTNTINITANYGLPFVN
jgi:hypothetical protein